MLLKKESVRFFMNKIQASAWKTITWCLFPPRGQILELHFYLFRGEIALQLAKPTNEHSLNSVVPHDQCHRQKETESFATVREITHIAIARHIFS